MVTVTVIKDDDTTEKVITLDKKLKKLIEKLNE